MPLESRCNGCGKTLRVADEHAGKQARCPACGFIYQVPANARAAGSVPAEVSAGVAFLPTQTHLWYMKTPEGQIYGPVSRETVVQWANEGRVSRDCFIREGERGAWQPSETLFPTLQAPRTRATAASTGGGYAARPPGTRVAAGNAYRPHSPTVTYGGTRAHAAAFQQPHRGALILTFALLGWFLCPIFAVVAWSMGTEDLNKIRLGQMDPAGQGITQAAQILGMIQSILFLIGLAMVFLCCLIGAVSG